MATAEVIKTRREELEEGDAHWKWKIAFRAVSIIVGLIGIGCAAWITAHFTVDSLGSYSSSYWFYYFDDAWTLPWTLITFALSVVWSAACIIVFFARRPTAPVHPGAQVGCDLVLWLGFHRHGRLRHCRHHERRQLGQRWHTRLWFVFGRLYTG